MIFDFFLDILFPRACVVCRRGIAAGAVCAPCLAGISLNNDFSLDAGRDARGAGNYHDRALQRLIHALKFDGIKDAAEPLGELIVRYLTARTPRSAFETFSAVPIPLARRRERARGFNQSALIAKIVAARLDIPFMPDLIRKTVHTKPQSETATLAERKENLRGVFVVVPETAAARTTPRTPEDKKNIMPENILLIDDVTTSGTTFFEAARALAGAGAKCIVAVAAAKAEK